MRRMVTNSNEANLDQCLGVPIDAPDTTNSSARSPEGQNRTEDLLFLSRVSTDTPATYQPKKIPHDKRYITITYYDITFLQYHMR